MADAERIPNLADSIFRELRSQILTGEFKPGERLPGERELATQFGSNRNTLREAVRRLEQANLVSVRHGKGVTVCDFRRTGTLELVAPYLRSGANFADVSQIIEDVLEPRVVLLGQAARLAAQRANRDDIQRLQELTELLTTAFETRQSSVVARGFQRWLDALVDAGHSVAIRWIANPFLDALRETLEQLPNLWILEPSFPTHLSAVVEAVASGNEQVAVEQIESYYRKVDTQLVKFLRSLRARTAGSRVEPATPTQTQTAEDEAASKQASSSTAPKHHGQKKP